MAKTCSNCNYCAENGEDWVCENPESEYAADFVEPGHVCVDWDGGESEDSDDE